MDLEVSVVLNKLKHSKKHKFAILLVEENAKIKAYSVNIMPEDVVKVLDQMKPVDNRKVCEECGAIDGHINSCVKCE